MITKVEYISKDWGSLGYIKASVNFYYGNLYQGNNALYDPLDLQLAVF